MKSATLPLQHLPWDSEFLGFPVARLLAQDLAPLQLAAVATEARQAGYHLVYVIDNPTNTIHAEAIVSAGAWLADRKVTFLMDLPAPATVTAQTPSIESTTKLTTQLESLAWQSGTFSRFRLDPHFSPKVFQNLYSEWLRNSLTGAIARRVLVWYDAEGVERGLLTLGKKNGRADIGLLAVDEVVRGQQVGQQLVASAAAQAYEWGYREIQVVTQRDNQLACRFYKKCGFRLAHEEHIYHLWLG
ncbi:GNAT family N-acetyltransferase [Hymenobacter sp. B1770]|uniref:GNAT family N-acetyltransferase n=1 Tax=Hymenobacter sp. B1770 TaxID=1718788 RepID=UPI003CFA48EA